MNPKVRPLHLSPPSRRRTDLTRILSPILAAVPRRPDGQAVLRSPEVGARVQGLPRLHRQLHEPPGPPPFPPSSPPLPLPHSLSPRTGDLESGATGMDNRCWSVGGRKRGRRGPSDQGRHHHTTATGWELTRSSPQLANTEEYQDGVSVGSLGEVFIRSVSAPPFLPPLLALTIPRVALSCNNVLQYVPFSWWWWWW